MNTNTLRRLSVALLICALTLVGLSAMAHDGPHAAAVAFEKSADGIDFPAEMTEGITEITFTNDTEAPFGPLLGRLNEGVTPDDFFASLEGGPMAALQLLTLLGGVEAAPESTATVIYDLKPGTHVLLEMGEIPVIEVFTVVEADENAEVVEAPEADVEVTLIDFAFALPTKIEAGEQLWLVENLGEQWHEMGIFPVEEGLSKAEYTALIHEMAEMSGPEAAAASPAAFWVPMGQGERAWTSIDLEPGTYAVICFLPDLMSEEGTPHAHRGMSQIITVE